MRHKAQTVKRAYTAQCKMLCIPQRKGARKLKYHICPCTQSCFSAYAGHMQGGLPPLGKATAHYAYDPCVRIKMAYQIILVRMTEMKGIVFTDNADNRPHIFAKSV